MKTLLATNHPEVNHYILKTHPDYLIVGQAENANSCMDAIKLFQPELVIISDRLPGIETWSEIKSFLCKVREITPDCKVLSLFTKKEVTQLQVSELQAQGFRSLSTPISEQSLSNTLYEIHRKGREEKEPRVVAVWSPKPGDGASLVTEVVSYVLCENRENQGDLIGVLDCNLRRPFLKYRYGLDESTALDDLLPYINSGTLSPEILKAAALQVEKMKGLKFIGGMTRPELFERYSGRHINILLDNARKAFAKIVTDAGGGLDNTGTVAALQEADLILTVMQPSYISKICLQLSLELFSSLGIIPNKLKIVLNRMTELPEEHSHIVVPGMSLELLGTLSDLGREADRPGHLAAYSGSGHRFLGPIAGKIREIFYPVSYQSVREEGGKGKLYRIITRGVG